MVAVDKNLTLIELHTLSWHNGAEKSLLEPDFNTLQALFLWAIASPRELSRLRPLQCNEIGREIWYIPGREEVQTAISRLFWSIEAFLAEEEHGGIMQAIMAVELLLPDLSDRDLLDRYLEAAVRIFEEYEFNN